MIINNNNNNNKKCSLSCASGHLVSQCQCSGSLSQFLLLSLVSSDGLTIRASGQRVQRVTIQSRINVFKPQETPKTSPRLHAQRWANAAGNVNWPLCWSPTHAPPLILPRSLALCLSLSLFSALSQFFYIPHSISMQRGHVLNYGGKKSDIDNTKQRQTVLLFLIS